MLASEFMTIVYKTLDQRLASKLIGDDAILAYINFAVADIYSYKGTNWTFMYGKQTLDIDPSITTDQLSFTLAYPIIRAFAIIDKSVNELPFNIVNIDKELDDGYIFYAPHEKIVKMKNNTSGIDLYYIHTFNQITSTDSIPLPDLFLGALFNKVATYCYPGYGQYGDGKDTVSMSKYVEQMENFRMIDSLQWTGVDTNIN